MRILILFYLLAIPAFAQQNVNWHKDFNTAKAIAEKSAKPMLVVFR
jgi:hypothetical protein